jgi:hypothetical protein
VVLSGTALPKATADVADHLTLMPHTERSSELAAPE